MLSWGASEHVFVGTFGTFVLHQQQVPAHVPDTLGLTDCLASVCTGLPALPGSTQELLTPIP